MRLRELRELRAELTRRISVLESSVRRLERARLTELTRATPRPWSPGEEKMVEAYRVATQAHAKPGNGGGFGVRALARVLGRPHQSVYAKLHELAVRAEQNDE